MVFVSCARKRLFRYRRMIHDVCAIGCDEHSDAVTYRCFRSRYAPSVAVNSVGLPVFRGKVSAAGQGTENRSEHRWADNLSRAFRNYCRKDNCSEGVFGKLERRAWRQQNVRYGGSLWKMSRMQRCRRPRQDSADTRRQEMKFSFPCKSRTLVEWFVTDSAVCRLPESDARDACIAKRLRLVIGAGAFPAPGAFPWEMPSARDVFNLGGWL